MHPTLPPPPHLLNSTAPLSLSYLCSIAGHEFSETTLISPDLTKAQLREQAQRAVGPQAWTPAGQAAIDERVREGLKDRRYVLVSVHTIRLLNQKGIMFSML